MLWLKKTGNDWYVAGITGDRARSVRIDFSFLPPGNYDLKILKDGPNADRIGTDYLWDSIQINHQSFINLNMAPGGGFLIRINPE